MTILALWSVASKIERHTLDNVSDVEAFQTLWNESDVEVHFYDMESHWGDNNIYGLKQHLLNGDEFEEDYNNEDYDGGHWCKVMHLPSDDVKRIIGI